MLVIRLQRTGRKNRATFRVVLQEKAKAPKSKALEILGSYNPHLADRKDQVTLKADRIKHWLSVGAQPSNTIHNMLVEFGIVEGAKKRSVQPKIDHEAIAAAEEAKKAAEEAAKAEAEAKESAEETAEEAPAEEKAEEASEEKKEEAAE